MTGTACFFNWFLVKKRTKREISGRFSGKTPYNRTTIFSKRNGFFMIGIYIRVAKLANFVSNTDQILVKYGKLLIKIWSNTDQILIKILSKSDQKLIKHASNTDRNLIEYGKLLIKIWSKSDQIPIKYWSIWSNTDQIRIKYWSKSNQILIKYDKVLIKTWLNTDQIPIK